MNHKHVLAGILSFLSILFLVLFREATLKGAAEGLRLCINVVIPSLFPFLFLTAFAADTMEAVAGKLLRPLGKLMGIPKGGQALLIPGFLGGYPLGAKAVADLYEKKALSRKEADRLLLFISNAGPGFFLGFLPGLFPEPRMILSLWIIHVGSAILVSMLFPGKAQALPENQSEPVDLQKLMAGSIHAMAQICGWILISRILLAALEPLFLKHLPPLLQVLSAGLLELTGGCSRLSEIPDFSQRFLLAAGLIGFGGLSVLLQTASILGKLSIKPYCFGKCLQAMISLLLGLIAVYGFTLWGPVLFLFLGGILPLSKKAVEKPLGLLYNTNTM